MKFPLAVPALRRCHKCSFKSHVPSQTTNLNKEYKKVSLLVVLRFLLHSS